jgi:cell division septum initiation protein DivIVA
MEWNQDEEMLLMLYGEDSLTDTIAAMKSVRGKLQPDETELDRMLFEAHREEFALHKAAKEAFDRLELKKIPRVAELNEEFNRLVKEKNAEYAQYRTERERMRDLANARRNAEMILQNNDFARTTKLISK